MTLSRTSIKTLLHYTLWSTTLFIPEYALFLALLKYTNLHYLTLTIGTFIFGITLQFALVRHFVFKNSLRRWQTSYALFVLSSCVGVGLVAMFMTALVELAHVQPYIARILAGGAAGYLVYLFNLYAAFKMPARSSVT